MLCLVTPAILIIRLVPAWFRQREPVIFITASGIKRIKLKQVIRLAHGNGGKLTQELIRNVFFPCFNNSFLAPLSDSAVFKLNGTEVAFTTDSYVIKPIFFPGGDIGKLSVSGTVNDLAVMGAKPLFISCSLIIEEGLPLSTLKKIIWSIQETAIKSGVKVITGDTKVVEKGSGDSIFINTAGIGVVSSEIKLGFDRIEVGDSVLLTQGIAIEGTAILAVEKEKRAKPTGSLKSATIPVHTQKPSTRTATSQNGNLFEETLKWESNEEARWRFSFLNSK